MFFLTTLILPCMTYHSDRGALSDDEEVEVTEILLYSAPRNEGQRGQLNALLLSWPQLNINIPTDFNIILN